MGRKRRRCPLFRIEPEGCGSPSRNRYGRGARMALPRPKPDDAPSATIASALRTLATERDGLGMLMDAIGNGLGEAFAAAVDLIAAARGRVIVTGMGKSGHIGRKIAATLASTGTPAYY